MHALTQRWGVPWWGTIHRHAIEPAWSSIRFELGGHHAHPQRRVPLGASPPPQRKLDRPARASSRVDTTKALLAEKDAALKAKEEEVGKGGRRRWGEGRPRSRAVHTSA